MRFGAAFWTQRTGWPELRDAVLRAEAAGFDDLWVDDHLLSDEGDWRDGKLEGWTTLAAVAAVTTRARLGLMVAANTFRNPGLTAKLATTARPRERRARDPRPRRRLVRARARRVRDRLRERLRRAARPPRRRRSRSSGACSTASASRTTARFYRMHDAVCEPRPIQARLPILIGGSGPQKTLPLVARHADLWNAYGSARARWRPPTRSCGRHATAVGRDEREIERTFNLNVVIRGATEAEAIAPGRAGATPTGRGLDATISTSVGSPGDGAAALAPVPGGRLRARDLRVPEPVRPRDAGPPA